jgi:protein-S-isoprenylcysteine O-methyltransferase Ste14
VIQRALASKGLVADVLACATRITLYFRWPFQAECGYRVIAAAPYRFMRHPGYLAMLISISASALAIGSWAALVPAACFVLVILRRAQLEDEFLKRNLPGYTDYVRRVSAKLLPAKRVFRSLYAQHKP